MKRWRPLFSAWELARWSRCILTFYHPRVSEAHMLFVPAIIMMLSFKCYDRFWSYE